MRPQVTFKTSQPLQQHIIKADHDEDSMDELRTQRDQAMDFFADRVTVLDHLEDVSGLEFRGFEDIDLYVISGRDTSIASPIMLTGDDPEVTFVEATYFLAKELLFQNLRRMDDHEMLEPGFDRFDVTAGMLAYKAVERVEDQVFIEDILDDAAFGGDRLKTWREVRDRVEDWDEANEPLVEHLGIDVKLDEE
jgi:hypothetical protein